MFGSNFHAKDGQLERLMFHKSVILLAPRSSLAWKHHIDVGG